MKKMKNILIVDDEPLILSEISKIILKFCDFHGEIKTIENGKDAVEEIKRLFYDICFLDINLPDLNGLKVMKIINKVSPETNIAIMTADSLTDEMKRTIKDEASLFIPKPFEVSKITDFVRHTFGNGTDFQKIYDSEGQEFIMYERRFKRKPYKTTITYSVSSLGLEELKGDVIDISYGGMGFRTDYPLEPGHVVLFKKRLGHNTGIVKWGSMINSDMYRIGVKFL